MSVISPHTRLSTIKGHPLQLGVELGRGGEATIFSLAGGDDKAVKIYHRLDGERAAKLRAMVVNVPEDPTRSAGHVSLTWPETLVTNSSGEIIGFIMPRIDHSRALPLHQVYHPGSRRQRAPGITWRYLVRIARNLCTSVAALHRAGYVVGDLNESNILVTERALVTLVDLDSIQVRSRGRVFRCPVGKAEYTPPELQGKHFRRVNRTQHHDAFGLAVLIFLLLMEGVHPFTGVYRGSGEPPSLGENIRRRRSPYLGRRQLVPAPTAPPFSLLPPDIGQLMKRAFGARAPHRPSAEEWQEALERLEANLITCDVVPTHLYSSHLNDCPWCARRTILGIEAYPPEAGTTSPPAPSVSPPRTTLLHPQRSAFQGSMLQLTRRLPLMTSATFIVTLLLGYLGGDRVRQVAATQSWSWTLTLVTVVSALLLPVVVSLALLHTILRRSPAAYRILGTGERLARAALGATTLALLASLAIGAVTGRGSVLAGDWLLAPSLWVLSFFLLWWWQRRGRRR